MNGPVALLTGADGVIGQGILNMLLGEGYQVVAHGYHAEKVIEMEKASPGRVRAIVADFTQPDDRSRFLNDVADLNPTPAVLINNAAYLDYVPFLDIPEASWDKTWAVNVTTPFRISQLIAQRMVQQRIAGRIIHITSINDVIAAPNQAAYASTKAALHMLGKAMARELASHGITVNMVGPAAVRTPLSERLWTDEAIKNTLPWLVPANRFGTADDVAFAVKCLIAAEASFITGQTLYVDGGLLTSKR